LLLGFGCGGSGDRSGAPKTDAQAPPPAASDGAQPAAPEAGPQAGPDGAPPRPVIGVTRQLPRTYKDIPVVTRDLYNIRGQKVRLDVERAQGLSRARAMWRIDNIARGQNREAAIHTATLATGEWPWAAAFLVDFFGDGKPFLLCGGSLVAPDWVLTAAHCDLDLSAIVLVGESNLYTSFGSAVGVNMVCPHENFDVTTKDFDLALVKLRTPVAKTPLPLQETSPADQPPTSATVIGWGALSVSGDWVPDLMVAKLPLVPDTECSAAYPGQITPNMLCAGDETGPGACRGDSGGPLMVGEAAGLRWYQLGVTSHGEDCSTPQNFGVYTRVSQLRQWIDDTIAGNNPLCPGSE